MGLLWQVYCVSLTQSGARYWWGCCVRSIVCPCTQYGANTGVVAVSGLLCIPTHSLELETGGVAVAGLLCVSAHSLELETGGLLWQIYCVSLHTVWS